MNSDSEELYKWVEEHTITRAKRNINRDFSDAIPLVEILKQHFPKLVELHNYSPKNAYVQKLLNWQMLNRKVLRKLKIHVNELKLEQLARGESGVIEKLLMEVKQKVETSKLGDEEIIYIDEGAVGLLDGESVKSNKKVQNRKILPKAILDKMEGDLIEKDKAVEDLKIKIDHMEKLLSIKDERIKDLTQQLQSIVNQTTNAEETKVGTRFFKLF